MENQTKQGDSVSSPDLTIKSKEKTPRAVRHYHQFLLILLIVGGVIYGYVALVEYVKTQKEIARSHLMIQTVNRNMFKKIILAGDEQKQVITPVVIQN